MRFPGFQVSTFVFCSLVTTLCFLADVWPKSYILEQLQSARNPGGSGICICRPPKDTRFLSEFSLIIRMLIIEFIYNLKSDILQQGVGAIAVFIICIKIMNLKAIFNNTTTFTQAFFVVSNNFI